MNRRLLFFAVAALGTAILLILVGWFTDLRQAMHGTLIAVAIFALLPFVITTTFLFLAGAAALVAALLVCLEGGAEDAAAGGIAGAIESLLLVGPYYRFMARQRHPAFWGIPLGLLLGGLTVWGLIALLVLPGETRTTRILAETRAKVEELYRRTGRSPQPDSQGRLPSSALGDVERQGNAGEVVLDGFDRPIRYQVAGRSPVVSYRLQSLGYDGMPSGDDLCVVGSTRAADWLDKAVRLADPFVKRTPEGSPSISSRLHAHRALRCPAGSPGSPLPNPQTKGTNQGDVAPLIPIRRLAQRGSGTKGSELRSPPIGRT